MSIPKITQYGEKMVSRNYVIGRNFEYRVIAYLRKRGYYCFRSFGSKGIYDIGAFPPIKKAEIHNYPLLIQAKSNGYIHPTELQNLKDNDKWQAFPLIAFKDKKSKKIKFRSLDGKEIIIP